MARTRQSKKNDVSSAAESTAVTSPPPAATPRQSLQHNKESPSPVKQANQREIKKKEASATKKQTRSTKKEGTEEEMRQ
eukprot:11527729-Ditylum_brightwellii.AAC.1